MRRTRVLFLLLVATCGGPDEVDAMLRDLAQGRPEGQRVRDLGPADTGAVGRLARMLRADRRRYVQRALIDALVSIGSTEALPALAESIEHPDADVRYAAAAAYWKLGGDPDPGLDVLLAGVDSGSEAALRAFAPVAAGTPEDRVDALVAAAAADPSWGRLEAIGAIGPRAAKAEPTVRAVLADPSRLPGVRASAAWALERTVGDAATAAFELVRLYRAPNPFVRRRLVPRIVELGRRAPDPVIAELQGLLREEDEELRLAGAWLLGEIGEAAAAALPALGEAAAGDPSGAVRAAAAEARNRIGGGP